MFNIKGERVMVTPSIIFSDEVCLAAVDGGEGGYLHVRLDGRDWGPEGDSHVVVTKVFSSDMDLISAQDDMRTPLIADESDITLRAMRAFVSFLSACAESKSEDSENYHLFDTPTREWAEMNSDELQILAAEIDEELGDN